MNDIRVIAITHKNFPLETIGKFHIAPEDRQHKLQSFKQAFGMGELMYLSTCNRVEIVFTLPHYVCPGLTTQVIEALLPNLSTEDVKAIAHTAERYNGEEAAEHLLRVASSLDSVIIGEREIITQLRKSYEESQELGLSGDTIRMIIQQCIRTAKEIFTHTDLSKKPVSVVSLAWQEMQSKQLPADSRIVLIGSGQIIRNFYKFLFENGYTNVIVANRTLSNAQALAEQFGGQAIALDDIQSEIRGFDVLVSCTASENIIVDCAAYQVMLNEEDSSKLVIDLALPPDIDSTITKVFAVEYIDMPFIQQKAGENLRFREMALEECEPLIESGLKELERMFSERQIEIAMRGIPNTIREIKQTALGSVFAKDLENLDENSKEVLEKILTYMEKKYISIPMKMAREVLLDAVSKN